MATAKPTCSMRRTHGTHAPPNTHKRPRTGGVVACSPPPFSTPPACQSVSRAPKGQGQTSPVSTGACATPTHAQTHVWGHAGGRSGRHDPLVATSHHACLSKCLPCHARGKGRLIQFQTINRSAIASSPFVQVLIISAGQVIKAWSGAAVNKCEANMKPASKVGPSRRAAIP
jgi:hypothetical protein